MRACYGSPLYCAASALTQEQFGYGFVLKQCQWVKQLSSLTAILPPCDHCLDLCSTEMVSMNDMMEMVKRIDNKDLPIKHIPGPEGVRGRNSDNKLILDKLGWEPTVTLEDGIR